MDEGESCLSLGQFERSRAHREAEWAKSRCRLAKRMKRDDQMTRRPDVSSEAADDALERKKARAMCVFLLSRGRSRQISQAQRFSEGKREKMR